jgi:protein tyrosine phosphatase
MESMTSSKPTWVKVQLPDFGITIGSVEQLEIHAQRAWILENCRAVINVTDSPYFTFDVSPWIKALWFPIDEYTRWPTTSLFGAKRALDYCHQARLPTFVHCSGGINRSRHIVALWLFSCGHSAKFSCESSGLDEDSIDKLVDKGSITRQDLRILLEANQSTFCLGSIRSYVKGDVTLESQELG